MDYFRSKSQPIALPLTSEKEPLVAAESAVPPSDSSPTPPASRKSKFRKALKIFIRLFLVVIFVRWLFYAHLHKKWFHRHHSRPCKGAHRPGHYGHDHHHHPPPHHGHPHGPPPEDVDMFGIFAPDYSDLQCDTMAHWSDPEEISNDNHYSAGPRFASNTSFTFPLSANSLLLYAHGRYSAGGVVFVEDDSSSDDIIVDISVHYWNQKALDQAQVCTLSRAVGEGFGIFTPAERHRGRRHDELLFKILVRFPKSSDEKPVNIKKLESILPMFSHEFPHANIHFDTLSVTTAHFPIRAESLSVTHGSLRTGNNVIVGNYTVTNSLELVTANAPINVNVSMKNANKGVPTQLSIGTANAPLFANVSLFSKENSGGDYAVDASTINSPLGVVLPVAPNNHVLHLSAKTTHSPARVALPPTYEGSFYLSSTILRPHVEVAEDVEDPKGEGRTREVTLKKAGHEIAGEVYWDGSDDDKKNEGSVEVTTSILAAMLTL